MAVLASRIQFGCLRAFFRLSYSPVPTCPLLVVSMTSSSTTCTVTLGGYQLPSHPQVCLGCDDCKFLVDGDEDLLAEHSPAIDAGVTHEISSTTALDPSHGPVPIYKRGRCSRRKANNRIKTRPVTGMAPPSEKPSSSNRERNSLSRKGARNIASDRNGFLRTASAVINASMDVGDLPMESTSFCGSKPGQNGCPPRNKKAYSFEELLRDGYEVIPFEE